MTGKKKPAKPAKEELPRRDENGKPICGARTKRRGGVCPNPPMANGRCYHHGGASPAPGPTHPNYKHGRLSKYLPTDVARRFEEARDDPELLSMRDDVALFDSRRAEIAERLGTGESKANWKLLKEAWGDFEQGNRMQREAVALDDAARDAMLATAREMIGSALDRMKKLITGGASIENQWDELCDITRDRMSAVAMETARLHRAAQMMTMGEVAMLLNEVTQAVMSRVTDKELLRDIGTALHYIMETGSAPPPKIAGGEIGGIVDAAIEPAKEPLPDPPEQSNGNKNKDS